MHYLFKAGQRLRTFYILVMLSYLPPFVWKLVTGQGVYQHAYHILLVLLASGVATGTHKASPRLSLFLAASMALCVGILILDALGVRFVMGVSLAALALLVLSLLGYYGAWALALIKRWRRK
ncbi:hypothetical protein CWE15_04640 [Aliidiomarina taiwanensis]|uniref:Uncharacterized protein n=1 Tax=Aliidiomarina taiwanensis TaxID=946228 RepID=A0A432X7B1_9GAMM|nr:hypothetical protein [Aliidiomarina taiwanensis]RUO42706.1 hypothetical protein CWE15_04640 [Aliidiomarina taiwanensis]